MSISAPTNYASGTYGSGTSVVINKASGVAQGDLMLAYFHTTATRTVSAVPSGWTLVTTKAGTAGSLFVYQKIAGGSEPADYTWTINSTTSHGKGMLRIAAASSSANYLPIQVAVSDDVDDTKTPGFTPGLTPLQINNFIVMIVAATSTGGSSIEDSFSLANGTPSWTYVQVAVNGGSQFEFKIAYANRTDMTATGDYSSSNIFISANTDWLGALVSITGDAVTIAETQATVDAVTNYRGRTVIVAETVTMIDRVITAAKRLWSTTQKNDSEWDNQPKS